MGIFISTLYFFATQVVKLYERCLIACANYPDYWIRYILCMETNESLDHANNALARATQVFVKVGFVFHYITLILPLVQFYVNIKKFS